MVNYSKPLILQDKMAGWTGIEPATSGLTGTIMVKNTPLGNSLKIQYLHVVAIFFYGLASWIILGYFRVFLYLLVHNLGTVYHSGHRVSHPKSGFSCRLALG
ncbi:MAG: hypothetical protein A2Y81_12505 [Nitrospirae bacterium RBG_13_43_8]|nr:MAG: hypothetical protein A2Y81_12505 [Nitrospirae bacterium RBG_13_43_8]